MVIIRLDLLADLLELEIAYQNWRESVAEATGLKKARDRPFSRHLFLSSLVRQSRYLVSTN